MSTNEKYVALLLEKSGQSQVSEILQMLRNSRLADLCYAYKLRVKTESKLIEKKNRKLAEKTNYSLTSITDVIGLRLVTLFKGEMVDVLDGILSVITHKNGINPNPFVNQTPEEIVIYSSGPADDLYDAALKERIVRHCKDLKVTEKQSKEGYSSIHLVTRLEQTDEGLQATLPSYKVPLEIQVRTVFEDAWGEIDHKYGYVIRSGKETGMPINNPEYVLAHLKVLKKFADACVDYAECIRAEACEKPSAPVMTSSVISVDADDDLVMKLKSLGINPELLDAYIRARELKAQATTIRPNNKQESDEVFLAAAEEFRELPEKIGVERRFSELSRAEKLLHYYAKMNEAVCLMSLNQRDHLIVAQQIYKHLEEHFPNYPLLKMRVGQALGRLGHIELAIAKLREAGSMVHDIAATLPPGTTKDDWPDNLPYVDYEHLRRAQPKLLGYHLWLLIQDSPASDDQKKATLFREALEVSTGTYEILLENNEDTASMRNNLMYYQVGYLSHSGLKPLDSEFGKIVEEINGHLRFFETNFEDLSALHIDTLDTLAITYSFLYQQDKARKIATIVMDKCLSEGQAAITAEEKVELLKTAHLISSGHRIDRID